MFLDHRFEHLKNVRNSLSYLTAPLYFLAESPIEFYEWLNANLQFKSDLTIQNHRLNRENLKLLAELQKYNSLEEENIRLRSLVDASFKIGDRLLIAELLSIDLDPYKKQVVISKGSSAGAYEGQTVIDANGIVGQISQINALSSTVLLITDVNHSIPVEILRNGVRTIALGTGRTNELTLPYLSIDTDIKEGDLLVTSGLGGKFPAGYPVAIINSIDISQDQSFAKIRAMTQAKIDRTREVLLVWDNSDKKIEDKTNKNNIGESKL